MYIEEFSKLSERFNQMTDSKRTFLKLKLNSYFIHSVIFSPTLTYALFNELLLISTYLNDSFNSLLMPETVHSRGMGDACEKTLLVLELIFSFKMLSLSLSCLQKKSTSHSYFKMIKKTV